MLAYADTESERITDNERGREQDGVFEPSGSLLQESLLGG